MARNTYDVDESLEQEFNWGHYRRLAGYIKPLQKTNFKDIGCHHFGEHCRNGRPIFHKNRNR